MNNKLNISLFQFLFVILSSFLNSACAKIPDDVPSYLKEAPKEWSITPSVEKAGENDSIKACFSTTENAPIIVMKLYVPSQAIVYFTEKSLENTKPVDKQYSTNIGWENYNTVGFITASKKSIRQIESNSKELSVCETGDVKN